MNIPFTCWVEDLERHLRRLALASQHAGPQRPSALRLFLARDAPSRSPAEGSLTQPKRAHQRNLRAAVRRLAAHRARPQVGDGRRAVRVLGVEVGEFPLRLLLDSPPRLAQLVRQLRAVAGDVLQHHLEDQAGHRVQVAGECLAAHPQRLQRNGAAAGEGVHHQGRLLAVRRLHQGAAGLQIVRVGGLVPIGEVRDELQQSAPQPRIRFDGFRPAPRPPVHGEQNPPRLLLERRRAMFVARVRQQQRHQHRPRRRQRPPRPPQMQRGGMPMPNGLLPHRMTRHLGNGEIHFGEALAVLGDHDRVPLVYLSQLFRLCVRVRFFANGRRKLLHGYDSTTNEWLSAPGTAWAGIARSSVTKRRPCFTARANR